MKHVFSTLFLLIAINASAQKLSSGKLDSLAASISKLQMGAEGGIYKDLKGRVCRLGFSDDNFYIDTDTRLAERTVYKEWNGKEVLAYTSKVDLSKATGLIREFYNSLSSVHCIKVKFPQGYLKTQIIEDGKPASTINEDCLEFFCHRTSSLMPEWDLYDNLYELVTGFKMEKGVMAEADAKSLEENEAAYNAQWRGIEKQSGKFVDELMERYKFKWRVTLKAFMSYNTAAAAIVKRNNYSCHNGVVVYTNNKVATLGKHGFIETADTLNPAVPFPPGPYSISLKNPYPPFFSQFKQPLSPGPIEISIRNRKQDIVERFQYVVSCAKDEAQVNDGYNQLVSEIKNNIDNYYIEEEVDKVKVRVPASNVYIIVEKRHYNNWWVCSITFESFYFFFV